MVHFGDYSLLSDLCWFTTSVCNCLSPRGQKDQINSTKWRIHSSYGPVSDDYCQEQEGEQRVKHGTHHVSNGSGKEEENSRLAWSRFCCRGLPRFQKVPKCSRHAVPMATTRTISGYFSTLKNVLVFLASTHPARTVESPSLPSSQGRSTLVLHLEQGELDYVG